MSSEVDRLSFMGRSWTAKCPWCDDGDYIDPRGRRHQCAHCDGTNEVEAVRASQLQGAVDRAEAAERALGDLLGRLSRIPAEHRAHVLDDGPPPEGGQ
jgi:hypothetical protein